ncbi:MAG: type II secretion system minor pseudopilin GspK [Acidiferrobacteraceae bacterium]
MNRAGEQGVALIVALLVVAIAASLAAWLSLSQQVWMRQAENLRDLGQSSAVTRGALGFAEIALDEEARNTTDDDLTQPWARPLPLFPVAGGTVTARIEDAEARFNLNNLFHNGVPDTAQVAVFQRLLAEAGLDPNLAAQVVAWITPATVPAVEQQADSVYLGLNVPYRAASAPFSDASELRLVDGFSRSVFRKLRPWVTALPVLSAPTSVNVNTAPAPVLAALFPNLPPTVITGLVNARAATPFGSTAMFMSRLPPGTPAPAVPIDVRSMYFQVIVSSRFGRLRRFTRALVYRPLGGAQPAKILWAVRYWPA